MMYATGARIASGDASNVRLAILDPVNYSRGRVCVCVRIE